MDKSLWFLLLVYFHQYITTQTFQFEDVSADIFSIGDDLGLFAAFSNFNLDGYTDIISLQSGGKTMHLLKATEDTPYFQLYLNCSFKNVATGVIPGDFNGDSNMDILLSHYSDSGESTLSIMWGSNGTLNCTSETLFRVKGQPLIADFNGDMIPDIIGESEDDKRYVWIASKDKLFTNQSLSVQQRFRDIHSSGLIDLDGDLAADMLITGENSIEMWLNMGTKYIRQNETIPYPVNAASLGQSAFVDLNCDGMVNHLMPICYDQKCAKSEVMLWNENTSEWTSLLSNFAYNGSTWGFKKVEGPYFGLPITLRYGDIDLDGFPDFITILEQKDKKSSDGTRVVIIRNLQCHNCLSGRSLQIDWDVPGLNSIQNIQIVTFFDLFEDGLLDVLVSSNTKSGWKMHALKNTEIIDSCFLKVLVASGLCDKDCTHGGNQPGPMVRYNITREDGAKVISSAVQLSQTAHFPLQLPYSMFGLGPTPNFIDYLTISIPMKTNKTVHMRHWEQIIPNSQIVVIPRPPHDESKWIKKLYVMPSRLVLLTCIALLGTCIFLSLIVALLHWKEKREDRREKLQDPYRFHFDAM